MIDFNDYGLAEWLSSVSNIPEAKLGLVEKFYSETAEKFSNL